jgi:peroxiredoxin
MALTPSSMPALGMPAADFTLPDTVSDRRLGLGQLKSGKATVVMFLSNHCPYVKHVLEGLVRLAHDYRSKGVSFIAIGCSDTQTYPEDSPERMRLLAQRQGFPFPYLYDESQEVARAYQAACTPDFFVFDAQLHLAYRGRLDDSRPGNGVPVTGRDLRGALNALLVGRAVSEDQQPSLGCSIKWREEAPAASAFLEF